MRTPRPSSGWQNSGSSICGAKARKSESSLIGKKAQGYFRYRGYRIERAFLGVTDTPGYGDARAVADAVMSAFASGEIDAVEAFFTRFQSAATQQARPDTTSSRSSTPAKEEAQPQPVLRINYEPSPAEILDRLLPRYIEAIVFNMLLEASASEHSARRRAMKAATDNADELIRSLTISANRARQAEITTEISEIVGGAEALAAARR